MQGGNKMRKAGAIKINKSLGIKQIISFFLALVLVFSGRLPGLPQEKASAGTFSITVNASEFTLQNVTMNGSAVSLTNADGEFWFKVPDPPGGVTKIGKIRIWYSRTGNIVSNQHKMGFDASDEALGFAGITGASQGQYVQFIQSPQTSSWTDFQPKDEINLHSGSGGVWDWDNSKYFHFACDPDTTSTDTRVDIQKIEFIAPINPPTVITNEPSYRTPSPGDTTLYIRYSGTLKSDGGDPVTETGFYIKGVKKPHPLPQTDLQDEERIAPRTYHWYYAYAKNGAGEGTGEQRDFWTPYLYPILTGANAVYNVSTPTVNPSPATVSLISNISFEGGGLYKRGFRVGGVEYPVAGTGTGMYSYTLDVSSFNRGNKYQSVTAFAVSGGSEPAYEQRADTYFFTLANQPSLVSADPLQNGDVRLTINKNGNSDITEYYVEKSLYSNMSSPSQALNWTSPGAGNTLIVPKSVLNGDTRYYFRLRAKNQEPGHLTSWSNIKDALTVPEVPNPTVTVNSDSQITVAWPAVPRVDSATIYYDLDVTKELYADNQVSGQQTTRLLDGVTINDTYFNSANNTFTYVHDVMMS